jgi:hypothetical protein
MMALFAGLAATANILTLGAVVILSLLVRRFWLGWRTPLPLVLKTAALASIAVALPIVWNAVKFNVPSLNAGGGALLISRLVDAGIAQRYLAENCPQISHPICSYRDELAYAPHSQGFLWAGSPSLSERLNAWKDPEGSYSRLGWNIVRTYPGEVAKLALNDSLHLSKRLTLSFRYSPTALEAGELHPYGHNYSVRDRIERYHRYALGYYDEARQQTGRLEAHFPATLYKLTVSVSYVALLLVLAHALLRGDRDLSALAAIIISAVLVGIAVHGGLVGPYGRYHVKVSWLASFALIIWVLRVASGEARRD